MNEIKTKIPQRTNQQRAASAQRRVSFSRPWSQTRPVDRTGSIIRKAKDKSNPVPRNVSFSRPVLSKPSLITNKGVGTRNKRQDATSSTTADLRRRSQTDPTPAHLKYGVFRKFSKIKKQSADVSTAPPAKASERNTSARPILVRERSDIYKSRQESAKERMAPLIRGPSKGSETPPPPLDMRHVHLCQTEPMHLDIKPKRFPSMLWC